MNQHGGWGVLRIGECMSSLWDLAARYGEAVEASFGEITPEVEAIEIELMRKVDACKFVIDSMHHMADQCHERAIKLKTKEASLERSIARLEKNLMALIMRAEKTDIDGDEYRAKLVKNPKRLVIDQTQQVPEEFLVIKTETVPNNAKIRELLDAGNDLPWAKYSQSYRLQWDERLEK